MSAYPIELTPDDNGTVLITCPLLPEVTTWSEDAAQAQTHARDAIEEALAARIAAGRDAPAGSDASGPHAAIVPLLTTLKVDLYNAMRAAGVTKAELGRRLRVHPPQIDRLLRLDHASRLDQIEAAFAALHYEVRMQVAPTEAA